MNKRINKVTDELIDRYLDGNVNEAEMALVLDAIAHDEELQEYIITLERLQESLGGDELEDFDVHPMTRLAASSKDNLCDVFCEQFILQKHDINFEEDELTEEALNNSWLKEAGTPLYNIGRLLERHGLQVKRSYETNIQQLQKAILNGEDVIVVVNIDKLRVSTENKDPNHAIVVLDYLSAEHKVRCFDPSLQSQTDVIDEDVFIKAWSDSNFYTITAKKPDGIYCPSPIRVDDIQLDNELLELREAIAENAHEVWASMRKAEGIEYGPVRDDTHNPCMVPYAQLPESEKEYDRNMAFNTIKLLRKLGYDIVKNDNTPLYNQLMRRIKAKDDGYKCSKCGRPIFKSQSFCENCGQPISWKDFI